MANELSDVEFLQMQYQELRDQYNVCEQRRREAEMEVQTLRGKLYSLETLLDSIAHQIANRTKEGPLALPSISGPAAAAGTSESPRTAAAGKGSGRTSCTTQSTRLRFANIGKALGPANVVNNAILHMETMTSTLCPQQRAIGGSTASGSLPVNYAIMVTNVTCMSEIIKSVQIKPWSFRESFAFPFYFFLLVICRCFFFTFKTFYVKFEHV